MFQFHFTKSQAVSQEHCLQEREVPCRSGACRELGAGPGFSQGGFNERGEEGKKQEVLRAAEAC
jgi:hypothetical protein